MSESSSKKPTKKSSKPVGKKAAKLTKPVKKKPLKAATPIFDPSNDCCSAVSGLPTGVPGIAWRDAAGVWQALALPTSQGAVKIIAADGNGLYLRNP